MSALYGARATTRIDNTERARVIRVRWNQVECASPRSEVRMKPQWQIVAPQCRA